MAIESGSSLEPTGRAFLVRDALQNGYGRGALAHTRWHRPFHGVRSRDPRGCTLYDRALLYLPRLRPGERFSHATALALLGCPIRVRRGAPVDVSSPSHLGRVQCRGVLGHRHRPEAAEYLCELPGLDSPVPVSEQLHAVLQSAPALPFPELVVALDSLLLQSSRRYDQWLRVLPEDLERFAKSASGRGVVRFREAAALARVGAESRMETLMRLAGMRAGLPELRLQADLYDARGGWIGRFDAVDAEMRSIYEYDGEQHLCSRTQRRRDARKHQAARDAGWRIRVFYREDFVEGLLPVGRSMLDFSGRGEAAIRPALERLLDEFSGSQTESAHPPLTRPAD